MCDGVVYAYLQAPVLNCLGQIHSIEEMAGRVWKDPSSIGLYGLFAGRSRQPWTAEEECVESQKGWAKDL